MSSGTNRNNYMEQIFSHQGLNPSFNLLDDSRISANINFKSVRKER